MTAWQGEAYGKPVMKPSAKGQCSGPQSACFVHRLQLPVSAELTGRTASAATLALAAFAIRWLGSGPPRARAASGSLSAGAPGGCPDPSPGPCARSSPCSTVTKSTMSYH